MWAFLHFVDTRVIMASAEDMRVLLDRTGGMERALLEQQGSSGSSHGCTAGNAAMGGGSPNRRHRCFSSRGHWATGQTSGVRWAMGDRRVGGRSSSSS